MPHRGTGNSRLPHRRMLSKLPLEGRCARIRDGSDERAIPLMIFHSCRFRRRLLPRSCRPVRPYGLFRVVSFAQPGVLMRSYSCRLARMRRPECLRSFSVPFWSSRAGSGGPVMKPITSRTRFRARATFRSSCGVFSACTRTIAAGARLRPPMASLRFRSPRNSPFLPKNSGARWNREDGGTGHAPVMRRMPFLPFPSGRMQRQ